MQLIEKRMIIDYRFSIFENCMISIVGQPGRVDFVNHL